MLSKSSGSPVATTRPFSLRAIGIILKRRASCGLISSITSCGTTMSARSIHCICVWAARLRDISSAETMPCLTSSSTTLVEPLRLALASSICLRVTSPASRRRSRTYSSFGGDMLQTEDGGRRNEKERRKKRQTPGLAGSAIEIANRNATSPSRAAISGTKKLKWARRWRAVARWPVRRGSVPATAGKSSHDRTLRRRRRSPPRRT